MRRTRGKAVEPCGHLVHIGDCTRPVHWEPEDASRAASAFSMDMVESGLSLRTPELSPVQHTGQAGKEGVLERENSTCKMKCEHVNWKLFWYQNS